MWLLTEEASAGKNKMIDHIIKHLSVDNNRCYIKHDEGSNTFNVLQDPQQKDKDGLFELILNTERNNQIEQQFEKCRT